MVEPPQRVKVQTETS
jgi:hypothetical protein